MYCTRVSKFPLSLSSLDHKTSTFFFTVVNDSAPSGDDVDEALRAQQEKSQVPSNTSSPAKLGSQSSPAKLDPTEGAAFQSWDEDEEDEESNLEKTKPKSEINPRTATSDEDSDLDTTTPKTKREKRTSKDTNVPIQDEGEETNGGKSSRQNANSEDENDKDSDTTTASKQKKASKESTAVEDIQGVEAGNSANAEDSRQIIEPELTALDHQSILNVRTNANRK